MGKLQLGKIKQLCSISQSQHWQSRGLSPRTSGSETTLTVSTSSAASKQLEQLGPSTGLSSLLQCSWECHSATSDLEVFHFGREEYNQITNGVSSKSNVLGHPLHLLDYKVESGLYREEERESFHLEATSAQHMCLLGTQFKKNISCSLRSKKSWVWEQESQQGEESGPGAGSRNHEVSRSLWWDEIWFGVKFF